MNTTLRRLTAFLAATALSTGGIGLVATSAYAADGNVLTVCASECGYTTIQAAVNAAAVGDTVSISAGTFAETVTVSKAITLEGAGSGSDPASSTILSGTSGNGLTLTGSITVPVVVNNIRVTGFGNGVVANSYVTLEGVASVGNINYGISVNTGATNLRLIDSAFDNNKVGFKLGSGASASNIFVSGSSFDNNSGQGWYSDKNATSGSSLTNVTIVDSTFNGNPDKGFYTEKLDSATFTNVQFNNSGNGRASQGAGLDLNLKFGNYAGITLNGVTAINSGTPSTPNGSGIAISARNDGSYADNPATLTGLVIEGVTISGAVNGLYLGFNIQGTPVVAESKITGNGVALINATGVTVDATHNWWGAAAPDFATAVLGDVTTDPWYADEARTILGLGVSADNPVVVAPSSGEIVVDVAAGTDNPRIDVTALMSGNEFTVSDGLTVTNSGVSLWMPAGTTATASGPWSGEFLAASTAPLTTVTLPNGGTGTVVTAIKVGSDSVSFTLDRAVRILLEGAGGSRAGFIELGGVFTPITTQCADDSDIAGNAAVSDCAITVNDGADLVIWTKHFTTFAAVTGGGLAATGADITPLLIAGGGLVLLGAAALVFVGARRRTASVRGL